MRYTTALAGISALFLFGLAPATSQAQTGWGEGGKLENAEIVVEKNRTLELPEANRNFEKFRIAPPKLQDRQVTYRFNEYRLPEHFINLPMRVLTIRQEDLTKLYGNYVKGGIGNIGTVYLRGYFHNKRDNNASYGAEVGHVSSGDGPIQNSNVASSFVQAHGEMYSGPVTLGGRVKYDRDQNNFYGFDRFVEVDRDSVKQVYNRFLVEGHLNNLTDLNAPLQFNGKVGLTYTADNFSAKETNVYGIGGLNYELGKDSKIDVKLEAGYTNLKDSISMGRGFFKVRPAYTKQVDKLGFVLGATIAYTGDTINDARQFNIYPAVEVNYQAIENKLVLFAGAGGDLQRTTLYSLSKENPWLNHNVQVADVSKGLELYAGVTGNLGKNVQFTGKLAHQSFRNLYFFNNAAKDSSRFDVVYDDGVTQVFNIYGELSYNQSEKFRVGLKAENNQYTTASLAEAFHRPSTILTAFGSYNLSDKILFNTELYYISSSFGQIARPDGSMALRETDSIMDLNIKADYRFSPRFSAFIMGNNLLSNEYERFVNYRTQGISVIGGVTYSF
ncbi:hypothetical protein [Nibribacter koreensis]|uniref:TonB dependent receptor n=1 Tax=Nibribacter koreensis TaxID=1084519 RepID=A0ABP8F8K7_9BACT